MRRFCFIQTIAQESSRRIDETQAALVFYWPQHDRQVRVEGTVTQTSAEESDAYFQTRPRDSQIGAMVSPQSEVMKNRDVLEQRTIELEDSFRDSVIKRPLNWGGYRLIPERIEFWKARPSRHEVGSSITCSLRTWTISRSLMSGRLLRVAQRAGDFALRSCSPVRRPQSAPP